MREGGEGVASGVDGLLADQQGCLDDLSCAPVVIVGDDDALTSHAAAAVDAVGVLLEAHAHCLTLLLEEKLVVVAGVGESPSAVKSWALCTFVPPAVCRHYAAMLVTSSS